MVSSTSQAPSGAHEQIITVEGISYFTLHGVPNENPSDAPLVLLSHALMANHEMWKSTTTALHRAGYQTLVYDHIGHNRTPVPPSVDARESSTEKPLYHFDDFTRHMRELVRQKTGSTHVHAIVGCSMGGVLALRYAMLYPSDVDVVISCDAPGLTSLEAAKPLWTERIRQLERDVQTGEEKLFRATAERWVPGNTPEDGDARAAALEMVRRCSLGGYRICADAIRCYDYTEQLKEIKRARCMVLVGSEDSAVGPPEVLEDVARRIDGAEFVRVEGAGHLPPLQRSGEFNRTMLEFLRKR